MSTDPNWLLSTLALSAAAIVAIIGGFLVSRVVSMNAAHSATLKRLAEVDDELRVRLGELSDVYEDRHSVSVEWFLDHHLEDVVRNLGEVEPEKLLEWTPIGSSDDEMLDVSRRIVDDVQQAIRDLDALDETAARPRSLDDARQAGVSIPTRLEKVYDEAIRQRSRGHYARYDLSGIVSGPSRDAWKVERGRQEDRIREEKRISSQVDHLRVQRERLELQRTATELPNTLYWGVAIFGYLTLVGVLIPISMMASRPVPDSLTSRRVVVGLFVSGVGALGLYLWRSIREMQEQ